VTLPTPVPGLVIRYSYLWLREHQQGREEGIKDRPCAIVLSIAEEDGKTRVTVLPITHSAPEYPSTAVEIPLETKKRLGLDSARSWIVMNEGNEFFWPGPDLRPTAGADLATIAYGFPPSRFFNILRTRYLALARSRRALRVPRTD
jgi:hypothetical protein